MEVVGALKNVNYGTQRVEVKGVYTKERQKVILSGSPPFVLSSFISQKKIKISV